MVGDLRATMLLWHHGDDALSVEDAMGVIDGLVQDCSNPSALAMELLQSCTKPSILPGTYNTQDSRVL